MAKVRCQKRLALNNRGESIERRRSRRGVMVIWEEFMRVGGTRVVKGILNDLVHEKTKEGSRDEKKG
ncbi:unnamed protein product [Sphenostylis stenocarpa]|uniref:Uncharacterized protein n=1 Tax=Sphenostylis stenocarpa TaxID=92480 RepID=A0AA86S8Q4_9FABA|nr:unnamed protein product [Sphenostylis stenocarpa]